jgi:polysaccharide biosynthesis transport protein
MFSRASVSNTPAYPKKLPILLIATLATLLLSSGGIATGELLRMTAPRALASPGFPAAAEPVSDESRKEFPRGEIAAGIDEIQRLADHLVGAGDAARKVTVLGTTSGESIALTTLMLARLMGRQAKIVVVDLAASSPTIAAVSADPTAPGLAELMQGAASFSQIITRDGQSRVHLVSAGRPGFDRAQLQSPRLTLAIDALLRVYDHVLLDAGTAVDIPAELLTSQARAVVVPGASMTSDARTSMCSQLTAGGFSEVTMLSGPCRAFDALEPGPRVVAA